MAARETELANEETQLQEEGLLGGSRGASYRLLKWAARLVVEWFLVRAYGEVHTVQEGSGGERLSYLDFSRVTV